MANRVMSPPIDGDSTVDVKMEEQDNSRPALTPPTSEGTKGNHEDSGSELSDLEPENSPMLEPELEPRVEPEIEPQVDTKVEPKVEPMVEQIEEILPDHYYEGGRIPVFKPVSGRPTL